MRQIKKHFDTSRQAEMYLDKLYGMYSHVRLIRFPFCQEAGTYIFEVQ
jgi:hypothetical protein